MSKKVKTALSIFMASLFLTCTAFTLSWFLPNNTIVGSSLAGSVLKAYFHAGDGSEENPFVITRPRQYENMIRLQYEMDGFWNAGGMRDDYPVGYNFEIGYQGLNPDDPEGYYVYNYDENGAIIYDEEGNVSYSKVLNVGKDIKLPPLGTAEKPFCGNLEGHDLTVSNFVVAGNGYNDIGIFGYVGPNGTCHNIYFKNVDVDTDAYNSLVSTPSDSSHTSMDHSGQAHVGYIAGHLTYADNFTDVYVNNCKFVGRANSSGPLTNNFGYYGLVETDAFGASIGYGDNYKFTLDSEAVYSYFKNNYDSIKDDTLVLKNTKETYYSTPDENGDKIARFPDKKISNAVTYYEDETFPTYNLQGDFYDPNDLDMNYSLSTLGYVDAPFYDETTKYHVYYKTDSGRYVLPPDDTIVTETPMDENNQGAADGEDKHYFYLDTDKATETRDGEWEYYECYNRDINPDTDIVKPTFKFVIPDLHYSGVRRAHNTGLTCTLYIDDTIANTVNITAKTKYINLTRDDWIFTASDVQVEIPYGIHSISVKVQFNSHIDPILWGDGENRVDYFYYGNIAGNNVEQISRAIRGDDVITLNLSEATSNNYTVTTEEYEPEATIYQDERSHTYELYAKLLDDNGNETGGYVKLYQKRTDFFCDRDTGVWTAIQIKHVPIPGDDNNHFIADSTELVNSGYSSENIDLVGHVEFYYANILNLIKIRVIRLMHDNDDAYPGGYVVKTLPNDKIDNKAQWYATQYAPRCIVLYLKNTANALDERDEQMGKIDFRHFIFRATPQFIKGNGTYLPLSTFEDTEVDDDSPLFESIIHANITESDVKKISYCCLNKDGQIIGRYNQNGNPVRFSESEANIDKYVLLLGCVTSGSGVDAWITNVNFEYKAEKGTGGNFGSVGYRDNPDRIEHTIFNFYISIPAGNINYAITVEYIKGVEGEKGRYIMTVECNGTLFVQTHLYDTTNYIVVLNGTEITTTSSSGDISSTGYTYRAP
ncbi:MAG: hypothetical protein MJ236_04210 [Clostridia bacterium]|nr:hypothetical protein [Clostridia bacterium]